MAGIREVLMGRHAPVVDEFRDLDLEVIEVIEGPRPYADGLGLLAGRRGGLPVDKHFRSSPWDLQEVTAWITFDLDPEVGIADAARNRPVAKATPFPGLHLHDCGFDRMLGVRPCHPQFVHVFRSLHILVV